MSEAEDPRVILAKHLLDDSTVRVRYQHEFSLAGFQALILINGGAIVGLLTYAGNVKDEVGAGQLSGAFIGYVIGLSVTVLAYLFAYYSQGLFMQVEMNKGIELLGIEIDKSSDPKRLQRGELFVKVAVVLTIVALAAFVTGSSLAMFALS